MKQLQPDEQAVDTDERQERDKTEAERKERGCYGILGGREEPNLL